MKVKKVLIPTDFSDGSELAARKALELSKDWVAEIRFLHVVETYPVAAYSGGAGWVDPKFEKMLVESARTQMETFIKKIGAPSNSSQKVEIFFGATASRVTNEAKEWGADIIVMSTHGRSGLEHFFLGSVAERVIRLAPCPVLIVPKGK